MHIKIPSETELLPYSHNSSYAIEYPSLLLKTMIKLYKVRQYTHFFLHIIPNIYLHVCIPVCTTLILFLPPEHH